MTSIGPLMVFLQGTRLNAGERELLRHPAVGGVTLFSRNYRDKRQLLSLVSEIKEIAPALILASDHEGGRVQRLRNDFTPLPPMRCFGALYEQDPEHALALSYLSGRLVADELHEVGLHTGFSPVLDLLAGSRVIGDRAWHADPEVVIDLTRQFIAGLHDGGVMAVGKHFPGHGTAIGDTHHQAVRDSRDYATLEANDLKVFQALVSEGILPAVMAAHVIYPQVDDLPASLSKRWLTDILRGRLGFEGLIFADDLAMQGVQGGAGKGVAQRMLKAGCDMVLICNDIQLLQRTLAEFSEEDLADYAAQLARRLVLPTRREEVPAWDIAAAREELSALAVSFSRPT